MAIRRRVIVTGTTGQLGGTLVRLSPDGWDIAPLDRREVDLADWRAVRQAISTIRPHLVVHCAAATDVDGCERDPVMAYRGNALATRHVARAAAACGAELVAISTNYVFDGAKDEPYHEWDEPRPISVYGASKLAGEREATSATSRCWIVRTAWVYAEQGRNFVATMRRLMRERERLTVVADQIGNPTYAADLARAIVQLVERAPFGIYHVTNAGETSWYGWASEIARLDGATTTIEPIPGSAYQRAASPPANGALTSLALPAVGIELPDWRDALSRCLTA